MAKVIVGMMLVLLGAGLRFFGNTSLERVQFEKIGVHSVGARTSTVSGRENATTSPVAFGVVTGISISASVSSGRRA